MKKFDDLVAFLKEVRAEGRKVVWIDRSQTVSATIAVLFAVLLIGFYLGIVDVALSKIVQRIIH
ncbi:MAG: preprotein translocase subunit SecE [Nitrospinota bacterium]|nr:preprotein translocase subunit SecE [Nitrospinota bacterium]